MNTTNEKSLYLRFHGRIIDSLGIQMYQSPIAAIAELIANAWDADSAKVEITLPADLSENAEIVIKDYGLGMTFDECQNRYLNIGRNRRLTDGSRTPGGRPCLGRKGIGKFAGFGIAGIVEIDTVSGVTGEHTVFRLDLSKLRSEQGEFVEQGTHAVDVVLAEGPGVGRPQGTTIKLKSLTLSRCPRADAFAKKMARRFLLAQQSSDFQVLINGEALPETIEPFKVEFEFPRDYREDEVPSGLAMANGWGFERLSDDRDISWQIKFSEEPVDYEDFCGVAVYCGVKIAQTPFFFHLSGGLAGQHGQQYLTGRVQADYLDQLPADIITTERQRVNWEDPNAATLLEWGQERIESLLKLWKERRAEERTKALEEKVSAFGVRLSRLPSSEARIVKSALKKLATIETLSGDQFQELGNAILTAWEGGKLKGLIEDIARMEDMTAGVLISLLAEEQVLSALHIAEVVKAKVAIIHGLRKRIEHRELENSIRDYVANNPWLISPEWETYQVEKSLVTFLRDAQIAAGIDEGDDRWRGRMDLVLRSGTRLIVLEFMRPGITADRDHFNRFQQYMDVLNSRLVHSNTALQIGHITGLLVADRLDKESSNLMLIERLRKSDMFCEEWTALLANSERTWSEFLEVMVERAPQDERLKSFAKSSQEGLSDKVK